MRVAEVIQAVKGYCSGVSFDSGEPIDEATTRDRVTYGAGRLDEECTGVVTCLWPTVDVICAARRIGANLIICHEALFWNHGDHQDLISGNATYLAKRGLLDAWGGVVWRCHDYIHSKVPIDEGGALVDGIFYGLAWKMGWLDCRTGNLSMCLDYRIPPMSGRDLAREVVRKLGLNGTRLIGDPRALVERVHIPMHVLGVPEVDNRETAFVDSERVDALVTMEFVDFTTSEYIRDAGMLHQGKCAITVGHFNLEEPGMEYMVSWLPEALGTSGVPMHFVPMGDTYQYVVAERGDRT